ncbi:MAG: hypothetical protein ACOCUH_01295 [Bacteriovoracia bacterium]
MLTRPSNKINFVVYQDQKTTKCFSINRGLVKLSIIVFILSLIVAITLGLYLFTKRKAILETAKKIEPIIISRLKQEKEILQQDKLELEELNSKLIKKLNTPIDSKDQFYTIFQLPKGFENKTEANYVKVNSDKVVFSKDKLTLRFNIENNHPRDKKVVGRVFTFLKSGNLLMSYPDVDLGDSHYLVQYNQGELFATSRFRPVFASFDKISPLDKSLFFKVIIFSEAGDLLLNKEIGPIRNEY